MKEAVIVSAVLKRICPVCFLLMVFIFQINAQKKTFDESVLSENGREAYQALLQTELFAFGGTDVSGANSNGEEAFDVLVKEKEAVSAFSSLVEKAAPEGGLYALFGLRMLKCGCFDAEFQKFINLPEPSKRLKGEFYLSELKFEIAIPEGSVKRGGNGGHFYEKRVDVANNIRAGKFDGFIKQKEKLKRQGKKQKGKN